MASNAVTVDVAGGGGGITGGSVAVGMTGASEPFDLWGPRFAVNFVICMQGIYPSRN